MFGREAGDEGSGILMPVPLPGVSNSSLSSVQLAFVSAHRALAFLLAMTSPDKEKERPSSLDEGQNFHTRCLSCSLTIISLRKGGNGNAYSRRIFE